jgi:hypothetical protein
VPQRPNRHSNGVAGDSWRTKRPRCSFQRVRSAVWARRRGCGRVQLAPGRQAGAMGAMAPKQGPLRARQHASLLNRCPIVRRPVPAARRRTSVTQGE